MEIVTLAYNRPDFIELQLNSLNKHVKNFNYTVYDNCPDDSIKDECKRLGVKCIPLKIFNADPSVCVAASLNQMWESLDFIDGKLMYIDSDMFLIGNLPSMKNFDFAFVPQVRPNGVVYPWTGLMLFNMDTIPDPWEMKWDVGYSLGADVGGLNHFYLQKYNPKVLELEMWTLIDDFHYSFNGADTPGHHKNYDKMACLVKDFPHPFSVDMFKVRDRSWSDCFVFHYKSASNYPDFYTPDYNEKKTAALKEFLWK
jgi:hypothetical protein